MKIIDFCAVVVAIVSVLIPFLYVLDDNNILSVDFPLHPGYLSLICLVVIAFLEILERKQ